MIRADRIHKMPRQKPGASRQDYQTPPELLRAIAKEFHVGAWSADLAAYSENTVSLNWFGRGSSLGEDSLVADWSWPAIDGDAFLNPPFAHIAPWAEKCATTIRAGRIFALLPAAVGSNWYAANVHGRAHVIALSPRVTFVGETAPYPKDLILAIYSGVRGGFSTWRWK